MKKIDLHIHTKPTIWDSDFEFCIKALKNYVNFIGLDCMAITNHNQFDVSQYNEIRNELNIIVLPGIELNVENGHLLLISDSDNLMNFEHCCNKVTKKIIGLNDYLTIDELIELFGNLYNYIVIPHYKKNPSIRDDGLERLKEYITAGEVNSQKKFVYCIKNPKDLVPVYFSDIRIRKDLDSFPFRVTFVTCGDISISAIKTSLSDKNKVFLTAKEAHTSFQIFEDGQELSTGLNVIVGGRSSGKSYTLNRISRLIENAKYIRQFSLVERDEEEDKKKFDKLLSQEHSLLTQEYLSEFKKVVDEVISIDLSENDRKVEEYINSLLKHAKEIEKHDAFSKAKLFREEDFSYDQLNGLEQLIHSVQHLIENIEYKEIISKFVSIPKLKALIVELIVEYRRKNEENKKREFVNRLIQEIKAHLVIRTAAPQIKNVDLYKVALDKIKIDKFIEISKLVRKERIVNRRDLQGFVIVANSTRFTGATDLKNASGTKLSFKEAYYQYSNPYEYLQCLKQIEGLPAAEYFKLFAKMNYQILNRDGFPVSGGERSEFNLLNTICDATRHEILLIDEPESSFDNLFLKSDVNNLTREISKHVPVVVVTHNSTVGASINPDYILHTKKEFVNKEPIYRIYSGYPSDKELRSTDGYTIKNIDATMNCLEAGIETYQERAKIYANLEN